MRKLSVLAGIILLVVSTIDAQYNQGVSETILKEEDEKYDNIQHLNKHYGDVQPGEIIKIMPTKIEEEKEKEEEPPQPPVETEKPKKEEAPPQPPVKTEKPKKEVTTTASKSTSASTKSSASSGRKSTTRKKSSRKRVKSRWNRGRIKKIKRKRPLGRRATCPRF